MSQISGSATMPVRAFGRRLKRFMATGRWCR